MRLAAGIFRHEDVERADVVRLVATHDLDVPDGNQFSACAAAGDPAMPGAVVVRAPQKR